MGGVGEGGGGYSVFVEINGDASLFIQVGGGVEGCRGGGGGY